MIAKFSERKLLNDIMREARVLNLHPGTAEFVAKRAIMKAKQWAEGRSMVTADDLTRVISKELAKYNKDLAFVYKQRDKII